MGADERDETFEENWTPPHEDEPFVIDVEGYEGPLDVLLGLAREQKVDLTRISILQLADQYLAFIARARRLHLELAADYLVMAAWLAYLKSRLLLPQPSGDEEPSGPEMAAALAFQLRRLEAMQEAGARLLARPRLGQEVFARGVPEGLPVVRRNVYEVSLYELLRAYSDQRRRMVDATLHIAPMDVVSIDEALKRLRRVLGDIPDWQTLTNFLPPDVKEGLMTRSALASTFAASLELARSGEVQIRQHGAFGPIYLRRTRPQE